MVGHPARRQLVSAECPGCRQVSGQRSGNRTPVLSSPDEVGIPAKKAV